MEELSYLVMTAGDAASYNQSHPHNIVSLNQLLDERSKSHPDTTCVGFIDKQGDKLICNTLTFKQLHDKVCKTAYLLSTSHQYGFEVRTATSQNDEEDAKSKLVAGLLAPSCEDFLVETFALFRLGWSVLLIAPQNTPEDIAGLCKATNIQRLLYHPSMQNAAKKAEAASKGLLSTLPTLVYEDGKYEIPNNAHEIRSKLSYDEESETDCIIFHSSGSSGTPKPIPQKHRIWTKAACCKPHSASFTTTPLFHGGISDLLRSMMSHSTLYMYPSLLPITASNLLQAFEACPESPTSFLSVPYIHELLAETQEGMDKLASFELVSTGGSPLAPHLGDSLVRKGVKLVSRYGSSESGFLMTSFRDFENDKEWNYLRPSAGKDWLKFEDQGDGTYELVVPKEWPTRNKANRTGGSYATSDLFRKHPTIKDAWILCGRSDDVILMSNGEKASPAPLESSIRKSSFIKEALVFGVNRSSLGVAVIPSNPSVSKEDIWLAIQEANKIAPAHAQISPELVLILPEDATFPKASKGTIQRGKAYEAYTTAIDDVYRRYEQSDPVNGTEKKIQLAPSELLDYILERLREVMQTKEVEADDDLFNLGLNSVQALRVRNLLKNKLDLGKDGKMPPNIVYECSTARRLANYIVDQQRGVKSEDQDLQLMKDLLNGPLNHFDPMNRSTNGFSNGHTEHSHTCLLTGATGSLGAHIISTLLHRNQDWHVVCLVRAQDDHAAHERVLETLKKHQIRLGVDELPRITCFAAKLPESNLGLEDGKYEAVARGVDLVIHAAWPVHFAAGLQSFVSHLQGLRNLIDLTLANDARFYFCSSTSAVLVGPSKTIEERVYTDSDNAVAIGYARSKFVAESICLSAWKAAGQGKVSILRLGQLSGDTLHGIWKTEEGWPQLFASAGLVGCLPDLDEILNWLPMDKAAEAVVDITTSDPVEEAHNPVYHVVSTSHTTTYRDALHAARSQGLDFETIQPQVWLEKLVAARNAGLQHSCLNLLDTWQRNYGSLEAQSEQLCFETSNAERFTLALRQPTTTAHLERIFQYWRDQGLFSRKQC